MLNNYNHFTLKYGNPNERIRKTGNIVYIHLPYLFEAFELFKDWSGDELIFVCEGGDVCLFLDKTLLITGNTSQFFKQYFVTDINHKIKKIYTTNLNFQHPLFSILPAGFYSVDDSVIKSVKQEDWNDRRLILCNFSHHKQGAASKDRSVILNFVKQNNWITYQNQGGGDGRTALLPLNELLNEIAKHKLVICPISNGFDTSRIWETYYLGGIPVVKKAPFFDNLIAEGFPMVVLNDWNQLLEIQKIEPQKLDEYKNQLSSIKQSGLLDNNYWVNKIEQHVR